MRVLAPAKINLHLRVGPLRGDGFHPLLTWMVTAGLFDTLTFVRRPAPPREGANAPADAPKSSSESSPDSSPDSSPRRSPLSLSCDHPSVPRGEENLVVRVGTALADTLSRVGEGPVNRREGVSAFLIKRIPPGAGLAGGSSDAAATLLALNRLWQARWTTQQLAALAQQFGSDLSFFFHAPSAICTGRGEIVRPIDPPAMKCAVLVLPKLEMPTPDVYRRFDELHLGREQDIANPPDWQQWVKLSPSDLLPRLVNDLEPAAFSLRPELGELRAGLERQWNRVVRMSGSGSSLFTLCDDPGQAEALARQAHEAFAVQAIAVQLAPPVLETTQKEPSGDNSLGA